MNTKKVNPKTEILDYLNDLTGRKYRPIKSNLSKVESLLKDGYTIEEIKEVIEVKVFEWLNNPKMSQHLNPTTLFRPSNFDKYINQVVAVKQNPELYKAHYAKLNKQTGNTAKEAIANIEKMGDNPLGW
ncbi:MAG: conserved phage C-terminal domain-containing protein [Flavobacteriales bacterium]